MPHHDHSLPTPDKESKIPTSYHLNSSLAPPQACLFRSCYPEHPTRPTGRLTKLKEAVKDSGLFCVGACDLTCLLGVLNTEVWESDTHDLGFGEEALVVA